MRSSHFIMLLIAFVVTANQDTAQNSTVECDGNELTIAYAIGDAESSNIYTLNLESMKSESVTQDNHRNVGPVWSPDGQKLAFMSNRDGNWEIYLVNADGSNLQNLTQDDG